LQALNALLNTITLPPGALSTQQRLVIDGVRGAIFEYGSGGPVGALLSSWARSAGTDPYGNPYPQGFSAGAGSVFEGTDYIISSAGMFFYSGTPAAGNLLIAIANSFGSDAFGNTHVEGVGLYGSNGSYIALQDNGGQPTIFFQPASVTHQTTAPQIFGFADNAGLVNEFDILVISSGKNGGDDAGIQLYSEPADGSAPAKVIFEFGGTIFAIVTKAGFQLSNTGTPISASGSVSLYSESSKLAVVDGADGNIYQTERNSVVLQSGFNVTTTTPTDIGLHLPVSARQYRLSGAFKITAPAANPGLVQMEIAAPSGAGGNINFMLVRATVTATGVAIPNVVTSIFQTAVNNDYILYIDGVVNITSSGTMSINASNSAAGTSFNVDTYSYIDYMPV
jgi:hypothetical protein